MTKLTWLSVPRFMDGPSLADAACPWKELHLGQVRARKHVRGAPSSCHASLSSDSSTDRVPPRSPSPPPPPHLAQVSLATLGNLPLHSLTQPLRVWRLNLTNVYAGTMAPLLARLRRCPGGRLHCAPPTSVGAIVSDRSTAANYLNHREFAITWDHEPYQAPEVLRNLAPVLPADCTTFVLDVPTLSRGVVGALGRVVPRSCDGLRLLDVGGAIDLPHLARSVPWLRRLDVLRCRDATVDDVNEYVATLCREAEKAQQPTQAAAAGAAAGAAAAAGPAQPGDVTMADAAAGASGPAAGEAGASGAVGAAPAGVASGGGAAALGGAGPLGLLAALGAGAQPSLSGGGGGGGGGMLPPLALLAALRAAPPPPELTRALPLFAGLLSAAAAALATRGLGGAGGAAPPASLLGAALPLAPAPVAVGGAPPLPGGSGGAAGASLPQPSGGEPSPALGQGGAGAGGTGGSAAPAGPLAPRVPPKRPAIALQHLRISLPFFPSEDPTERMEEWMLALTVRLLLLDLLVPGQHSLDLTLLAEQVEEPEPDMDGMEPCPHCGNYHL